MNPMKLNIAKPAIQVAVTDIDGNVFFHTMTLEKAEIIAKEIANTIREMRTGNRADEVDFIFWNTSELPKLSDEYLVSFAGIRDGYVGISDYGIDRTDPEPQVATFDGMTADEVCGWAEVPKPVKNCVTADKWGKHE